MDHDDAIFLFWLLIRAKGKQLVDINSNLLHPSDILILDVHWKFYIINRICSDVNSEMLCC